MVDGGNGLMTWIVPVLFVAGGAVFGFVFEKLVLHALRKIAEKTKWEGDEMIVESLKGMMILWFVLAGVYGAVLSFELDPKIQGLVEKGILVGIILSVTLVFARLLGSMAAFYSKSVSGILPSTSLFQHPGADRGFRRGRPDRGADGGYFHNPPADRPGRRRHCGGPGVAGHAFQPLFGFAHPGVETG